MTQPSRPHGGRWILGGVVFLTAAGILFEARGMTFPRPAPPVVKGYQSISVDDADARAALRFALADQKQKNRSSDKLLAVLTAERQASMFGSGAALVPRRSPASLDAAQHAPSLGRRAPQRPAPLAGENFRLCLSLDRRGRSDTARVVVHRNQKQRWSVALWAWGACGKTG
jgi:hypothetical protein